MTNETDATSHWRASKIGIKKVKMFYLKTEKVTWGKVRGKPSLSFVIK